MEGSFRDFYWLNNNKMDSQLFRISLRNVLNGLIVAVGSAVLLTLQGWITNPDFSVFALGLSDLKVLANIAAIAGGGYLVKKFFSDSEGKVLGKI